MAVDISKIKPGDEVAVRAKVRFVGDDGADITVLGVSREDYGKISVFGPENFVSHTPRELEAGDGVRFIGTKTPRVVVAVDGEFAWVRTEDASAHSVTLKTSLERIP